MGLSVIGAGFGRTGTYSLNLALEMLGFGPCHHMADVQQSNAQKAWFRAAGRGEKVDWDDVYAGFNSAVDWPTCHFWRELAAHYPAAKIILSTRDPAKWYDSARATIFNTMSDDANTETFGVAVIRKKVFSDRLDDKAHVMAVMEAHNRAVIDAIPPERLLVYQVSEGWPRLCAFLGVPVPAEPFPLTNTTDEFRTRVLKRDKGPVQAG
jgi:hypothetical protein